MSAYKKDEETHGGVGSFFQDKTVSGIRMVPHLVCSTRPVSISCADLSRRNTPIVRQTVIQEARVFNETPISPRKCRILLTKIIYLLYVGETFGTQEATTLFFGVTKLFQHKDVSFILVSE